MASRILGPLARSVVSALCCSSLLWRRLQRLDVLRDRRHCWCTLPRAMRSAIDSASCAPCAALLWYRRSANSCSSTWSESLSSRAARSWCWSEPLQLLHGRLPCRCGLLAACSSRSTPPRFAIVRSSTRHLHVMIMLASRTGRFHQPRRHQTVQVHPCVARLAVGSASSPARRGCHPAS